MVMTYVVTFVLLLLAPLAWRKGWHQTGLLIVSTQEQEGWAYCQLARVPRQETLNVRWSSAVFSQDDYALYKNILIVRTGVEASVLARHPFSVSYLPDSAKDGERTSVSLQDGAVFADGRRLAEVVEC